MGRINEIQKDIKISYGNNTLEIHIEPDGIRITPGNGKLVVEGDVVRNTVQELESNSLIIKQELDEATVTFDEKINGVEDTMTDIAVYLEDQVTNIEQNVESVKSEVDIHIKDTEQKFENIEEKTDIIDQKLEATIDDVKNVDEQIEVVGSQLDTHTQEADEKFKDVHKRFDEATTTANEVKLAKRAYEMMLEKERTFIQEIVRPTPPTPKQIKNVQLASDIERNIAIQQFKIDMRRYPTEHELQRWIYMNRGYSFTEAESIVSGQWQRRNQQIFYNMFEDCV